MTAKPPRASTKSEARADGKSDKRPKRAATQGGAKLRSSSVVPTDQFLRITDDEIVEVLDATGRAMPAMPPLPASLTAASSSDPAGDPASLRLLVLESATHLATAQAAIVAAGHQVVRGAAGTAGIDKLRPLIGEVDAILIALPGGEPLLDAVLALGPARPVAIGSITASAVAAARRATASGADLFVVRPHDLERLAPILFAAARLADQRRQLAAGTGLVAAAPAGDEVDVDLDDALADLDAEQGGGALQPLEVFQAAVERELGRAQRYGYPLSLAVFGLEVSPPPPPAALRGLLRARTGNALVNAVRDVDVVAELEGERFVVLLPYTDRLSGAEVARRILSSVAAADPILAGGRAYPPKVIGAVVGVSGGSAAPAEPPSFEQLLHDAIQLLEQASVTGASLAVET